METGEQLAFAGISEDLIIPNLPNRAHTIHDLAGCETAVDRSKIVSRYFDRFLELIENDADDVEEPVVYTVPITGDFIQAELNDSDQYCWVVYAKDEVEYSSAFPRVNEYCMLDFEFSLERSGDLLNFVALDISQKAPFIAEVVSCNGYIYTFQESGENGRSGKCYHASNLRDLPVPQKAWVKPVRFYNPQEGRCYEYVFEFLPSPLSSGAFLDLTTELYTPADDREWSIEGATSKGVVIDISRRVYQKIYRGYADGDTEKKNLITCRNIKENRRAITFDSLGRMHNIGAERPYCIGGFRIEPKECKSVIG